ncbi:MAG TPA: hypothetical protein VMF61_10735 [Candidatus Acidoferrales bacterium]|nr:hypothetical protein [Candidatus Acidoferrales bacterium]
MIARGFVEAVGGGIVYARLPAGRIGDGVRIGAGGAVINGTVCAAEGGRVSIAPHRAPNGIAPGMPVCADPAALHLVLGSALLGRAIDAAGAALDGAPVPTGKSVALATAAPDPRERRAIDTPFWTGVRCIDGLLTIGRGARVGIFGAPGTGKSTLLESIVAGCRADAVVVGLVGERGREAERWLASVDARTTLVVATSDRSAAERVRAAFVSAAQACALRRRGLSVVWVLDSLARTAQALRELGIALGESTGRAGYPPSVFAEMARLTEVAGALRGAGSITLVATVLDDGDDRDPVSDAARSLLDGHLALSPRVAASGRFPAIDVGASASRTMPHVVDPEHAAAAAAVRGALSLLEATADARALGIAPAEPAAVAAIAALPGLEAFLRQDARPAGRDETLASLYRLADTLRESDGYY